MSRLGQYPSAKTWKPTVSQLSLLDSGAASGCINHANANTTAVREIHTSHTDISKVIAVVNDSDTKQPLRALYESEASFTRNAPLGQWPRLVGGEGMTKKFDVIAIGTGSAASAVAH